MHCPWTCVEELSSKGSKEGAPDPDRQMTPDVD